MKRQVRRLGVAMLVLYAVLFIQLNVVQVVRANDYNSNPANIRAVTRDYGRPRGQILAADGTLLARSVADNSHFKRRREYPEHGLFAAITGSFSFTFGSDGVEKTYNDELSGRSTNGSVKNFVDLLTDQQHTNDVVVTVNKAVQQAAKDALGDRAGSVVAIDPRDGSILALWSFPTYDPEPISQTDQAAARQARTLLLLDPNKPLLPRSFRETFFPGSTFKVVTASAGLSSGKVTPEQPVYPTETQFVPPNTTRPIRNFGGERCGGNLFDILRVSCNTSFARMGVDLGAETLVGQAQAFGFGETPPLDLPNPAAASISGVDFFKQNVALLAQTAIGQNTVRATPLQMAMVAAGIANNGVVMTPHVLKEVRDDQGNVVRRYNPSPWKTAVTPQVAATVRDAMVQVAQRGTATRLQVPGVPTAGKTGTAQIGNGKSHAWIIGFAPATAPRVAIAVIVESQSGASEATGGRVAAPIGQKVLQAALNAVPAAP
ncbi:MAG: cell division protein FtsI/penicillin-binding protein 2 [Acidimicrobiales bacterium]|nr:cell division protein FtsI/penicillin-binding protein 2 [Acidimicrobiales bacterium]